MVNKKICLICLLVGLLTSHLMAGEKVTLFKDQEGNTVQISLDSTGIIESIDGSVNTLFITPLTITINDNFIFIKKNIVKINALTYK